MSDSTGLPPTASRQIEADPGSVWTELTDPDGFERWMGEGSSLLPDVGGRVIVADPETNEPKVGVVTDVEPGRRLCWVWRRLGDTDDGAPTTEVQIELERVPVDELNEVFHTVVRVIETPSVHPVPVVFASATMTLTAACR